MLMESGTHYLVHHVDMTKCQFASGLRKILPRYLKCHQHFLKKKIIPGIFNISIVLLFCDITESNPPHLLNDYKNIYIISHGCVTG